MLSLGMHLTPSCLLYEILALISAAVTAASSSVGAYLQKWLFPQWSKQQLQLEKKKKIEEPEGTTLLRV